MGIHNTVTSEEYKYTSSLRASDRLIGTVNGKWVFPTVKHIRLFKGDRHEKKNRDTVNDAKLQGTVRDQGAFKKILLQRAKHKGAWMSVRDTMVNGTVLSATQLCDFYVLVTTLNPLIYKTIAMVA